jgi:hypothetical protein
MDQRPTQEASKLLQLTLFSVLAVNGGHMTCEKKQELFPLINCHCIADYCNIYAQRNMCDQLRSGADIRKMENLHSSSLEKRWN